MEPKVLYEDKEIIIVIKPYGISSQSERGSAQDMISILTNYFHNNNEKNAIPYVVHRLDKNVSGVMVYAKNKNAAAELSKQIAKRDMEKKYLAVAFLGEDVPKKAELVDMMYRDGSTNTSYIATDDVKDKDIKKAHLSYEILKEKNVCNERFGLIDITLHTGRHHQIRVQFANRNLWLLGDKKYGNEKMSEFMQKIQPMDIARLQLRNIALYSYSISFKHPVTKKRVTFESRPEYGIFKEFTV